MDNKIHYSPKSLSDLDEIFDYIAYELKDIIAAENTVNGIVDSIHTLKQFAESGSILCIPTGEVTIYRYVVYGNYLSFYHISENEVYIDRIIYGKRDYIKILGL